VEDREVGAVGEGAAAGADEHAAVWSGAVLLKMGAEQQDEFGVDWHWPGFPWRSVLEFASLAGQPLSVHSEPLRGSECVSSISPHPCPGRLMRLSGRRSAASSGRSAA
jgi:hypothetical protein